MKYDEEVGYSIIDVKDPQESFQSKQSQLDPIDYKLLVNKEWNWNSSWVSYFAYDVWSSSGATGDTSFRKVNIIWTNNDRETTYTQEILVWRWNTTAKITRNWNITITNNSITLKSWQIIEIFASFNGAWQNLNIVPTWSSYRYVRWTNRNLTPSNDNVAFINSGTVDSTITLTFATSASERPIFWILIKIY